MMHPQPKERDLFGGRDVWSNLFPYMDIGYFILGWFTVTIEVFLRHDFGERYYNKLNFLAGFLVLGFWALIIGGISSLIGQAAIPLPGPRGEAVGGAVGSLGGFSFGIFFFWLGYVVLGILHFIRIWWRNRTNQPIHSLDPGKSRLEWLGKLLIGTANLVASIPVKLFARTLSDADKEKLTSILPIVQDSRAFTERFLEPILVWLLGFILTSSGAGVLGLWLVFGAVALSVYTNYRYEAERHQFLDLRDQMLEAKYLPQAMAGLSDTIRIPQGIRETVMQTAEQMQTTAPEIMEEIEVQNPSLADAMAALNPKLRNIAPDAESTQ